MAAIVHRCACGHLDSFHTKTAKGDTEPCRMAGCGCADVDPGAPEVIPTWRAANPTAQAMPDPVLIQPGTVDGPGMGRLCDCEDCWALFNTDNAAQPA
ncbi:hypothetical protein AB0M80_05700 [Amycolatopsis sp. NPDC051045]|uniref:hypothetical protein n=1 Tax=Amycolatopsis sp. NPDC051045 TaxID=3156922 RepID=UPI00341A253E